MSTFRYNDFHVPARDSVGRMVATGRRTILRLTSPQAISGHIRHALNQISSFGNDVKRTAEQLSVEAVWAIILSAAFIKWLRGKVLHPISEQDQIMLRLARGGQPNTQKSSWSAQSAVKLLFPG
ncbi:MAG: hypothetical protein ACO398_07735 [Kiritimatiellia bacterium]